MRISIASRIRVALLGVAVGIGVIGAGLALMLLYSIEDGVFVRQLGLEQASLNRTAAQNRFNWEPATRMMVVYWSRDQLPQKLASVIGDEDGIYEYFDAQNAYFVLKGKFADTDEEYILTYDVDSLLVVRSTRPALLVTFGVGTLVFVLVAMVVALSLSRATLSPLRELTAALQTGADGALQPGFATKFGDDEVGVLANALDKALQQVAASSRREFEFNRGVSHELRSPIQVVKNSAELLCLALRDHDNPDAGRALERLARATEQMGYITEAFLWLACDSTVEGEKCSALVAAERLLEDHEQLLAKRSMSFSMYPDDVEYQVPLPVLLVVVGNLLRNAIQHSDGKEVRCSMRADRIVIDDDGTSREAGKAQRGFGIGLEIVERICQRLNWQLQMERHSAVGVRASIVITDDEQALEFGSRHLGRAQDVGGHDRLFRKQITETRSLSDLTSSNLVTY